jgi:hypothetical protein
LIEARLESLGIKPRKLKRAPQKHAHSQFCHTLRIEEIGSFRNRCALRKLSAIRNSPKMPGSEQEFQNKIYRESPIAIEYASK